MLLNMATGYKDLGIDDSGRFPSKKVGSAKDYKDIEYLLVTT